VAKNLIGQKVKNQKMLMMVDYFGVNQLGEIIGCGRQAIFNRCSAHKTKIEPSAWAVIEEKSGGKFNEDWYNHARIATKQLAIILDKFECEALNNGNAEEYYEQWGFVVGKRVHHRKLDDGACEIYQELTR